MARADGKDDVNRRERLPEAPAERDQLAVSLRVGGQRQFCARRRVDVRQPTCLDREPVGIRVGEHPGALLGDADRHGVKPLWVQVAKDAAGRHA